MSRKLAQGHPSIQPKVPDRWPREIKRTLVPANKPDSHRPWRASYRSHSKIHPPSNASVKFACLGPEKKRRVSICPRWIYEPGDQSNPALLEEKKKTREKKSVVGVYMKRTGAQIKSAVTVNFASLSTRY